MVKQLVIFLIIVLLATSSFALDKKIEKALIQSDWQEVYDLLEKKNKYQKDPLHQFLMYQACFAIDCNLNINYPRFNEKSIKKLSKWVEKFSSKNQNNIISKHLLSELYLIKGKYRKAIQYSIEISDEDSSFIPTYNTRCNAFIVQGDYKNALIDLNKLLSQDSAHSIAYHNRGVVYDEMQDYANALKDYEKSIVLNPKSVLTYYNQGNTYRHMNNDSMAIVSFNKAIEYDSNNFSSYYNRGNTYFDREDFVNSKNDYEKFLKLAPKEMHDQKSIIKRKLEIIENGGSSIDEQEIEKIITNAYKAWINEDWENFTTYIHPIALSRYKEAALPMYAELFKGKDEKENIIISGIILNKKNIRKSTDKKFFEIEAKISYANKNSSRDMSLPKSFIVNKIEKINFELLNVYIYTTYINGNKQDEELGFLLDGTKWKILLPAPFMRLMIAMIEHYNK